MLWRVSRADSCSTSSTRSNSIRFMSTYTQETRKYLTENNRLGMSAEDEPIHWNFQNALFALADAVERLETENNKLRQDLSNLESRFNTRL